MEINEPGGGVNISDIVAVFQGGPKRENPVMTTNTVTARRKRRPSTYVEGNETIHVLKHISKNVTP